LQKIEPGVGRAKSLPAQLCQGLRQTYVPAYNLEVTGFHALLQRLDEQGLVDGARREPGSESET
jgi:hypothetical protein